MELGIGLRFRNFLLDEQLEVSSGSVTVVVICCQGEAANQAELDKPKKENGLKLKYLLIRTYVASLGNSFNLEMVGPW